MSTSRHQRVGRREFLKTSTCALATVAVGPQLFAGLTAQPKLMVAGFAPLEIESAGTDVFTANVVDARRAPADAAFRRYDARISAYGLSGGDPRHPRALDFCTHYAVGSGQQRRLVPFHTWVASGRAEGVRPVSFTVPVDEEQRIRFSMTAKMPVAKPMAESSRRGLLSRPATTLESRGIPIELSLHRDANTIELSRGFYVIVPVYDGESAPNFSAYSLRRAGGRWTLHDRSNVPASFEHFVIRVDHAEPRVKA